MSVSITVGFNLNGPIAKPHIASAGELTGGPERLLQWLESQLGLEVPSSSFTERLLQYLSCLKQSDNENRFFHQSLVLDELGVAKRLLLWRDNWYESGWQGGPFVGASQRLVDMAEVETLARQQVAVNSGQRVQRVLSSLEQADVVVTVITVDPINAYPEVWQQLLSDLKATFVAPHSVVRAEHGSDLAQLQSLLLDGVIPDKPSLLSGDGTVLLLRAPSYGVSAPWLAHYCQHLLSTAEDYQIGLLCDGSSEELDLALAQAGVATQASGDRSPWRPVFQVLPLAMDLLWTPLNPNRLLEFLSHPVGPISRRVRQSLAEVVAREPGIGGELWNHTVQRLLETEADYHSDPAKAKKAVEKLQASINFWLGSERYSAYPGAPVEVAVKRALAVSDWLSGLIHRIQDDTEKLAELALYHSAQNQLKEFVRAIQLLGDQGAAAVNADTLRRLIKAVRGEGTSRPDRQAQLMPGQSKLCGANDCAAFIAPLHTSIWWGCDSANLASPNHWTALEQQVLAANGVVLMVDEDKVAWQTQCWLRPLLAAQQQTVIVVHETGEGHHPLFDQLQALAQGLPEYDLLSVTQSLQSIDLPSIPKPAAAMSLLLPGKQRLWQLPSGTSMPKRECESFSSLESFLFGPYMWVLRYQAKLKSGALLSVSDNNLLKGSLAHQLYENFFNAHKDIADIALTSVSTWAEPALDALIASAGAVLLMPGRAAEREHFIRDAVTALVSLVEHLQSAQVVSVVMESHAEGLFVGGALAGYLDLLASKADGSEAVIDIKWGSASYRKKSITESRYLQLAIYAKLRRLANGSFPKVGYFVIASQELLMLDCDYFPNAESIEPDNEENIAEFWWRFEKSWQQRREQLNQGMIEVNVKDTEVIESLLLAEDGLANAEVFDSFSEFGVLVGWEADA
jgi:ATP-dependent helicase/nuclease subunit B